MAGRILVVDDEPAICELMSEVITAAGFVVFPLSDSSEAARHLALEKFDAIFLDVNMPAPDGPELARRARASGYNQRTPIVMIAGDPDPASQKKGFAAGADFFLYKPFDRQRLLRIVRVTRGTIQQERRRFQRVMVRVGVRVECSGAALSGETLDMSLNGMLARLDGTFPAAALVALQIRLTPQDAPLHAVGRIARTVGEDCMGIHIERMNTYDQERLQQFLLPMILSSPGV